MSDGCGHFEGDVITKWLKDDGAKDRTMELLAEFAYIDSSGQRWEAAEGRKIDGASIPSVLWNSVGPPYVGDYRRATVLHDVACQDQAEPDVQVHRMFYHAMRCDGVGRLKAAVMYQAVRRFGPSWDPRGAEGSPAREAAAARSLHLPRSAVDFDRLEVAVESALNELDDDVDLDTMDKRVDELIER